MKEYLQYAPEGPTLSMVYSARCRLTAETRLSSIRKEQVVQNPKHDPLASTVHGRFSPHALTGSFLAEESGISRSCKATNNGIITASSLFLATYPFGGNEELIFVIDSSILKAGPSGMRCE